MNSLLVSATVMVAVVALFAWQGYRTGALPVLRGLLASLAGYLAAYSYAGTLVHTIQQLFALNVLPAFALACAVPFMLASILANVLLGKLRNVVVTLREGDEDHDPVQGAVAGACAGMVVALLAVWVTGLSLEAVRVRDGNNAVQDEAADPLNRVVGHIVAKGVSYAVEQKTGPGSVAPDLVGELVANPVAVGQQLKHLSGNEGMRTLFTDPAMQDLLSRDDIAQLQLQPAFRKLIQDPVAVQLLNGLDAGNHPLSPDKEKGVAVLLASLWHKGQRIKADPHFNEILGKPEIQALLANPSPLALLGNHDIQALAQIAFSDAPASPPVPAANPAPPAAPASDGHKPVETQKAESTNAAGSDATQDAAPPADPNVIYRWTDKNGQIHYSQKKPEGNEPVKTLDLK